jgi:hypothetical protein
MTKCERFLVKEEAQTCASIGDVSHTRARENADHRCVGNLCLGIMLLFFLVQTTLLLAVESYPCDTLHVL